jgi:hypothetical protein
MTKFYVRFNVFLDYEDHIGAVSEQDAERLIRRLYKNGILDKHITLNESNLVIDTIEKVEETA